MSEKEMVLKSIFGEKYVCAFCNERKSGETAVMSADRVGICRICAEKLSKTALSLPYQGTRSIAYIMSPFEYTGIMREAILTFKFRGASAYAPLFAKMSEEYLDSYGIWDSFDYIAPVPLHESRLRERGYNQSELIAGHIAEYIKIPMRTDLLKRTRATKRQSGLKHIDRVLNVRGAFSSDADLTGKSVILFDDICTTGTTLQACASALTDAGAKNICALTLAIHVTKNLPLR